MTAPNHGTIGCHVVVTRKSPCCGKPITTPWLGLKDQIQILSLNTHDIGSYHDLGVTWWLTWITFITPTLTLKKSVGFGPTWILSRKPSKNGRRKLFVKILATWRCEWTNSVESLQEYINSWKKMIINVNVLFSFAGHRVLIEKNCAIFVT